ncbi:ion channel [Winogradskyella sp. UBA3174]|uniref:ion channel n=1 Tax=Winogradskyella sp. UBA3174 TaxID=1947785 RepID=UPI0025EB8E77|nr:ion channel [Winogradskyella sp. UBA3174]
MTLMTIGYGDILPVTPIAQKASIFIGLIGQFYLVILTAIVVSKYINQKGTID